MPRANRYTTPGQAWHITHRCHQQHFLLKFARDRRRWIYWLFKARQRFGLSVLNYVVTSNHIHLLVYDTGRNEIPRSMQLVAGRVAQEYNARKSRKGAFWEDRYHATAVAMDEHLVRCLVYMDLNMVRAGVVKHPELWVEGGYTETMCERSRYRVIDHDRVLELVGLQTLAQFRETRRRWIGQALEAERPGPMLRDARWTASLAVGAEDFVTEIRDSLGLRRRNRTIVQDESGFQLKEDEGEYKTSI